MGGDSTIRIRRPLAAGGLLFTATVLVDGRKVGTVKAGGTLEFAVDAGDHLVQLKSPATPTIKSPVSIRTGETQHWVVRPGLLRGQLRREDGPPAPEKSSDPGG